VTGRVAVVIPTWNAGPGFGPVLAALTAQADVDLDEVLVLDSESTDDTPAVARAHGARVRVVRRATFNHGLTRNLGVALTRAPWVAFLTQDALPANRYWLHHLVVAAAAEDAVGAYGRVLPRVEATPLVARSVCADLVHRTAREVKRAAAGALAAMDPFARRVFVHFNNVSSLVRRDYFAGVPFPDIPFGEDLAWSERALADGRTLVYEPRSLVWHSHESGWQRDFLRHRQDAVLMRTLFGFRNREGLRDCLPALREELRRDWRWLRRGGRGRLASLAWLARAVPLRACQVAGQWAGSGREHPLPPSFPAGLPACEREPAAHVGP